MIDKNDALLFDLGGVIVDIRREDCVDAFEKLGFSDISEYLGDYGQKGVFLLVEEGKVTVEEFHAEVRRHIPHDVSDEQIDAAFNAFITGIPRHRLEALRRLRAEGRRLYVISNTNPVMWHGRLAEEFGQEGMTVYDYFDGVVTSFETGCCKPDRAIFDRVVEEFGITPDTTVFFDDSEANCRKGEELGFKTVHVGAGTEFTDFV